MAGSNERFADVAVENTATSFRKTFSYRVPERLNLRPGSAVWVPFGKRTLQGIVFRLTDTPGVPEVRDILDLARPEPVVSPQRVEVADWIARHYLTTPYAAISAFLPDDFGQRLVTNVSTIEKSANSDMVKALDPADRRVYNLIRRRKVVVLEDMKRQGRADEVAEVVNRLMRFGLVRSIRELQRPAVRAKQETWVAPAGPPPPRPSSRQMEILDWLADEGETRLSDLREVIPNAAQAVKILEEHGSVKTFQQTVLRDPLAGRTIAETRPPIFTAAQAAAWKSIEPSFGNGGGAFLLHGVTGSGKTEIYLAALAETVARGKRGIVLVPEIALTPQIIERFSGRFPGRVAILHSRLTPGEHFDEWTRVRDGMVDVVVGSRSAIFAPMPDLGLIVVDEEHEWSYKQNDLSPRYHARDVALELGRAYGATVILGTATPDVTTYQAALDGRLKLVELRERPAGGAQPPVEVVDLRSELKAGNRSIFSRLLRGALAANLSRGEQSILYLNRRGSSSVVLCRSCGYVAQCRRCSTVLTYHAAGEDLVCHSCNLRQKAPDSCPNCRSRYIRFLGSGTQSVVEEVARLFPTAKVARLDSDIGGRNAHQVVLQAFANREVDILVGTQLVAKGHDLPGVSLVGVVNADVGLYLPDFRAGERVFQLLTQVAGRPGRQGGGQTIVQTYSPDHYVIKAASRHDYRGFFEQEIAYRRERRYPPFSVLARLLYPHRNESAAIRAATHLHEALTKARSVSGLAVDILGPAPAYFRRVRGRYRWQLVLRGDDVVEFLNQQTLPQGWIADVDPLTLL